MKLGVSREASEVIVCRGEGTDRFHAARLFHHLHGLMWPAWQNTQSILDWKHQRLRVNSTDLQQLMSRRSDECYVMIEIRTEYDGLIWNQEQRCAEYRTGFLLLVILGNIQLIFRSSASSWERKGSNCRLTATAVHFQKPQQLWRYADQHLFWLLLIKTKARR